MKLTFTTGIILFCIAATTIAKDQPPRIIHEPVKAGVKGQRMYIRATVRDDQGAVKAANLYCSVSSDSAPFKVKMRSSGAGAYIGAIPNNLLQNASEISYYIEAVDSLEQTTETPWYTIKLTSAGTAKVPEKEKKKSLKKPLLIGGGIAAVAGGIAIAAGGGGGSGDNDSTGGTGGTSNAGIFSGSATRYFQLSGGSVTSETYQVVINIQDNGTISSDNLHPEDHVEGTVTDGQFSMTGSAGNGLTGDITYSGSVAGSTLVGNITGAVVTSEGVNGTYSGSFSATKQ